MSRHAIDDIVKELLAFEPSLADHAEELRSVIGQVLAARPDTRFDPAFAESLKRRLLRDPRRRPHFIQRFIDTFSMQFKRTYLLPAGTIAAVAILLMIAAPESTVQKKTGPKPAVGSASITKVAANAFGSLAGQSSGVAGSDAAGTPMTAQNESGTASAVPRPTSGIAFGRGGGGGGMAVAKFAESAVAPSGAVEGGTGMIAPDYYRPIYYTYVVNGEKPTGLGETVDIIRRVKQSFDGPNIANGLGLIDLSGFGGLKTMNYSMVEDKDFGYVVNVDLNEGIVSINPNWPRWPHPENECRDEACWSALRLKPEMAPSDEELISIADAFLDTLGIDRMAFGKPVARTEWRLYAATSAPESIYVPDEMAVVYPYVIDGKPAYDDGGPIGLNVNVNARYKKVASIWNLTTQHYESSAYAAASIEEVIAAAERGGVWGWVPTPDMEGDRIQVELGTPESVWTRHWTQRADGTGEELLVPAYRFPVLTKPANDQYFRDSVVIPLIKDAYAGAGGFGGGGGIEPMPLPAIRPMVK